MNQAPTFAGKDVARIAMRAARRLFGLFAVFAILLSAPAYAVGSEGQVAASPTSIHRDASTFASFAIPDIAFADEAGSEVERGRATGDAGISADIQAPHIRRAGEAPRFAMASSDIRRILSIGLPPPGRGPPLF